MAEKLVADGCKVTLVTPHAMVASWTELTLEQHRIQARLLELGVRIITSHELLAVDNNRFTLGCIYSGKPLELEASSIVMVVSRLPQDQLYYQLADDEERLRDAGIQTLKPIGDCHGPATIAAAVYEGHRFARELGEEASDIPYRREITELADAFKLP